MIPFLSLTICLVFPLSSKGSVMSDSLLVETKTKKCEKRVDLQQNIENLTVFFDSLCSSLCSRTPLVDMV